MFLICFKCCLPICLMTIGKVTVKFQVVDIFQELYQKTVWCTEVNEASRICMNSAGRVHKTRD